MNYIRLIWKELDATINLSIFHPTKGVKEYHAVIELTNKYNPAETQFKYMAEAMDRLKQTKELKNAVLVLKRYFVSDAVNQKEFLPTTGNDDVAVSIVQQPPLNGTKVMVWLYWVEAGKMYLDASGTWILERPHFKHLYTTQLQNPLNDEGTETKEIFQSYTNELARNQCTLKDNCIRTWIYVQGVDTHYAKMVTSRTEFFTKEGLTRDTHYIASTGIEGKYLNPQSLVLMDAYAVKGIKQEQIKFLQAPTHLNPTYEYGVTFERATAVDYGDRRQIYVSGTASINNKGEIVHSGNVEKQIERTLENIQALLAEADTTMSHVAKMIVYLRDTADYEFVFTYLQKHYAEIPKVIAWAPVCRPGWLVEIECIALKEIENKQFATF